MKKLIAFTLLFVAMCTSLRAQDQPKDMLGIPLISNGDAHFALHSSYKADNGLWTQKYLPIMVSGKFDKEKSIPKDELRKAFKENATEYILISFVDEDLAFATAFENVTKFFKTPDTFKKIQTSPVEGSMWYDQKINVGKKEVNEDVYTRVKRIETDALKGILYFQYFHQSDPSKKMKSKFDEKFELPDVKLLK